jgi:hypothetical protein
MIALTNESKQNSDKTGANVTTRLHQPNSRVENSPYEPIMHLQRSIGNQAVQRLLLSGAIQARSDFDSRRQHAGVEQQMISRKANPACALSINTEKIVTEKTANAPSRFYGASFNHKFEPEPEGCNLAGVQVTEYVETIRDDFNSNQKTVKLGENIWTLTKENKLNKPDNIWSRAGAKGLGVNPVNNWPAVMDHNQIWHYRHSNKGSWERGPGIVLKLTLNGDRKRKDSLRVTTIDHGVSREEPYRGPDIRMRS